MNEIVQKKFTTPEAMYFVINILYLLLWGVFILAVENSRPGDATGDFILLIFPISIPWIIWSLWLPFLIIRSIRQWRIKKSAFFGFKILVYSVSFLFILSFIIFLCDACGYFEYIAFELSFLLMMTLLWLISRISMK